MGRFINPFTDTGFKRIFGREFSKPILIRFLNALLHDERTIVEVTFLDKEQIGVYEGDRSLIYDVMCQTETGERVIVEMQNRYQPCFKERSIYYAARAIVEQGERGRDWNYDIKAIYLIAFMDFQLTKTREDFRIDVALMDMQRHTLFTDKVRFIYLQLPCFTKQESECENDFDRMIFVLKHMDVFERMPWAAKDAVFSRLAEIAEVAALEPEERRQYEADVKHYRDTIAVMEGQYKEGEEKGHAEGRAEGLVEGEKKGRAEGILSTARKLKQLGLSVDIIANATGLSESEIDSL